MCYLSTKQRSETMDDAKRKTADIGPGIRGFTRRGFMSAAAGLAGAAVGAPLARAAADDPVINFIQTGCGEKKQAGPRILVGYASRCGTTGAIAETIGKRLCGAGARVDIRLIGEVDDPEPYDAFVLGSAIQAGQWLHEANSFLGRNKDVLARAPVAYFIVCLALSKETPQARKIARKYAQRPLLRARKVDPVSTGAFAGAVYYAKMPKRYHGAMKRIHPGDGDYRDYDAIALWADRIAPMLMQK